jgi:hypothetical protein
MAYSEARTVISLRLSDAEISVLDNLVHAEPQPANWWDPKPTRSSVIRAAIADRNTALEQRNTRDPV